MGSSGVEFDTDSASYGAPRQSSGGGIPGGSFGGGNQWNPGMNRNESKMVQWLIRHGFAKTPGAAQGIMIVVMIINFIITYFVIAYLI